MTRPPFLLAFDTAAAHCAAAVVCGSDVLAERRVEMTRGQAESLMPLLAEVLADAGVAYGDLSALAVGVGPGNFTGIRISVAAARGLALSLNRPAIGIDGFCALALDLPHPVIAAIAAPRGAAYVKTFGAGIETAPALLQADELTQCQIPPGAAIVGSGAQALADATGAQVILPLYASAAAIGLAAASAPLDGHPRPAPLYVRAADAAPARDTAPVFLS